MLGLFTYDVPCRVIPGTDDGRTGIAVDVDMKKDSARIRHLILEDIIDNLLLVRNGLRGSLRKSLSVYL